MAMEKDYTIYETHSKSITAIGSNFIRREIYLGYEDGIIKSVEIDTGKHIQTYIEHKGWVTSFLYWPQTKILFSASNDSIILAIGAGGNVIDKVFVGTPIYSMSLNYRRKEIIFGTANGLQFHKINENKINNHYIEIKPNFIINEHRDIVKCVFTSDSRIFSAGYDGALVIYDSHYTGLESAIKFYKNQRAHDAGISSLIVEKDNYENNTWLVTGSFDKTLKIWTNDGKLIHKFDGFITAITGICYIPKNKTIWCVAGTNTAYIYDPKSGENVTDFIDTFTEFTNEKYYLQSIKYFNDFNVLLTTTSRKQVIVYKYNPFGCLTSIKHKKCLDSICYTKKVPILLFTGDSEDIFKWEQTQSNQLIYSSEKLMKTENVTKETPGSQGDVNNKILDYTDIFQSKQNPGKTILKLLFFEKLDLIIAACEDSNIYVWGFDEDSVTILKNMNALQNDDTVKIKNLKLNSHDICSKLENLENSPRDNENIEISMNAFFSTEKKNDINDDSVTNRVAGFKLKAILNKHTSCVTSLSIVEHIESKKVILLSSGWDRRICIWDLERLRLFDIFQNSKSNSFENIELASDGSILDICYNEKKNCFAYASSDTVCYIRKFSLSGSEMVLENILQGHKSEVNSIKWNSYNDTWITGGEDATMRIWSYNGECLQIVNCGGAINAICLDPTQESVVLAVHDTIKVYEYYEYRLVQNNIGHTDSIRDIIIVPERNCFISVSWDKTIKIWRSWRKPKTTFNKIELDKEKKFENWIWTQIKKAANCEKFDLNYID